jgi:LysM repeat protein
MDGAREVARGVVSDVVNLFLQERAGKRASGAADAVSLLEKESRQLEDRIKGLENDLARYKRSNASTLPELTNLKLTQLERFSHEFTDLQNQIRELENRKAMRTADLAMLSPNVGIYSEDGSRLYSPEEQLLLLRAEYAEKSARYSPEYPDLVNLAGEIRGLEAYVRNHQGAPAADRDRQLTSAEWKILSRSDTDTRQAYTVKKGDTLSGIAKQYGVGAQDLADLNKLSPAGTLQVGQTLMVTPGADAAAASNVYPAANPDVQRLAGKIAAAANEPPVSSSQPAGVPGPRTLGDNPNYLRTRAELDAVERDLVSSRSRAAELQTTIRQYEEDLSRTPEVERQLNELLRKLDEATTQLGRVKEKQLDAELARAIESSDAGGQFALAEPISIPNRPDQPNRSVMLFLSLLLAVAGSSGIVLLTELRRKVIYDARSLHSALNIEPLVVIPRVPPPGGNIKRLGWQGRMSGEAA